MSEHPTERIPAPGDDPPVGPPPRQPAVDPGKPLGARPLRRDASQSYMPVYQRVDLQSGGVIHYIGESDEERLVSAAMEAYRQTGGPVRVERHRFGGRFTVSIGRDE